PRHAVVGGEEADRRVEILIARRKQRPPPFPAIAPPALDEAPELPERLLPRRVDVRIRLRRRGPGGAVVARLGADDPRLPAGVAVVAARKPAGRVENQAATDRDELRIA